ncbi:hypothetical protein AB0N88_08895 [Streptomyces sp. NPDC093516]|uniref:hypothetical protein n=1 Tax=Streptomyces sp. NPDC093516 TaxID=3155304 RepID=UPI0034172734
MTIMAAAVDETFWTALGAMAAVLAVPTAVGVGWLAYRAVWPRRRVRWSVRVSPLMSHGAAHTERLTISFTGQRLDRPHIVEVQLSNVGNKDLEPAHFHGQPLEITSSARVLSVLQSSSKPATQRVLPAREDDHTVTVSADTPFHKGQTLTYVLLVDGAGPSIGMRASLSNTKLERRDPPSLIGPTQAIAARIAVATAAGSSVLAAITVVLTALSQ